MVDVDLEIPVDSFLSRAGDVGALEKDDQVETAGRNLALTDSPGLGHSAEGQGKRIAVDDGRLFSEEFDHPGQGQAGADGVAIRSQMTGDGDPAAGQDLIPDH